MHVQGKSVEFEKKTEKILFLYALFLIIALTYADDREEKRPEYPLILDAKMTASRHGSASSIEYDIVCPYNGVMTGINYRSTVTVDQIEFICTSSMGLTTFGPYGGGDGKIGSAHCPPHHYISSFYGSNTTKLNRLGIRCRHQSDMFSEGKLGGEFGEENGTHFDELALSIGARPVSVTIHAKNNTEVNAIEVIYSNNNITDQFAVDHKLCQHEWAEEHGSRGEGEIFDVVCPKDGVINLIQYTFDTYGRYSENRVTSIKFRCTSSLGDTYYGPFGTPTGPFIDVGTKCDGNQYISSIKGFAGSILNSISVNCAESGKYVHNVKQNEQSVLRHISKASKWFDDICHTTEGRRPVRINIWAKKVVNAIQVKYVNLPVAYHCTLTHIQVVDKKIIPENDGFEVIGFASGSTCSALQQQIHLDIAQSESSSEENGNGMDVFIGEENGFYVDGLAGYNGIVVSVIGGSYTRYAIDDIHPSHSNSTSNSSSTTQEKSNTKGTTINYQGPGAAVVVGYRRRYKIEKKDADVLYHYTCEGGSKAPKSDKVNLATKIFSHVFFEDYQFNFNNTAECTPYPRYCVANIKINKFISHPKILENAFRKCFQMFNVSNDYEKIPFEYYN